MIRGIGVDVVDIQRMKETLVEQGDAFRRRVFTEAEIDYCDRKPRPYENYAARFAAKEAVSKALETGWSGTFRWKDVEVLNDPSGAPKVGLKNETAKLLEGHRVHLTLSHSESTVVAFVVIERLE
ncbi:MAG: holo-[acyl-carrier-protein] synthase [Ignavibacteria bacterium GWA2_55_11]|nr:MAG: holo-[acyl-carrier-protein] synthase [Ignavibacteria bacterium GWA2_55_11]OGU65956.1 MAG: holo-[acyl-carrier-protein] synthase [Ignavibacteria bacterium RIFCSPHIGHO2_02_FULL_56_12]OGU70989.1 MAG: holo-[acyl-carrier-protein] synthase [Ignavibacteria bacterium RIFCSPLOWO2_02_FULL_55_14]HAV24286.1 holo-[acyl-carrier-protein] synthase [Bacteroidota bacterium]